MLHSKTPITPNHQEAARNNGGVFSQGTAWQLPEYPFIEPPE